MNTQIDEVNAIVQAEDESSMVDQSSMLSKVVSELVVNDEISYKTAAEYTKQVKAMNKKITDYFEPLRKSTYDAYQNVMAKKKEMLSPLETAEKALKKKMGDFAMEQERIRREKEEALRRAAREEAERKLAEAAAAEASGDAIASEVAMMEAEAIESAASDVSVAVERPKADGASLSKVWKITSIDNRLVPIDIMGIMLRPVDEKAIMSLIKMSKGTVQIPGVTYEETVNVRVRA